MNSPRIANIYMLLVLACQLISRDIVTIFREVTNGKIPVSAQLVMTQLFSFLPPFIIYILLSEEKVSKILSLNKISLRNILYVVSLSILVQPAMMIVSGLSAELFGNQTGEILTELNNSSYLGFIITVGLIPAIFEEITFRGVVYKNYASMDYRMAAVINGLFFGLMHMSLHQFFYVFFLGTIISLFVYHTGTILASMLAHFMINASQVTLIKLSQILLESDKLVADVQEAGEGSTLGIFLYEVAFVFLFCYVYWWFKKYNEKRKTGLKSMGGEDLLLQAEHREEEFSGEMRKQNGFHWISFIIVLFIYGIFTL